MNRTPQYPLYIVSKGRARTQRTHRSLAAMGVPHYIVVEPDEVIEYREAIGPFAEILELDLAYKARYDLCDEYGLTKPTGPGPARNYVWDHAVSLGAARHWVMDDNIAGFFRFHQNLKTPCVSPAFFAAQEDFVDRFANVAMSGPNYFKFIARKSVAPPYITNTRIYSCNLIRNDAPYRWRGRYNEDTDLSLRMLKDGLVTVQFNAWLQDKTTTQLMQGGNTTDIYAREGTLPKSEMLAELHPDVARVTFRFGRWHHVVDYSQFDQKLRLREGVEIPAEPDEYGMVLQQRTPNGWTRIDRWRPKLTRHYSAVGGSHGDDRA